MNRWLKFALLSVLAIVVAEVSLHRTRTQAPPAGSDAPAFTLPDTDGKAVSLAGLKGKVVAVNFWATWCGPCREEIPELSRIYAAHRGKCFELLGIAEESGPRDDVVAMASKLGVNYPILLDDGGKVGDAFRIPAYPRTYLIDSTGRIRRVFEGAIDRGELEQALAPLLGETRSPACPRA